ncbi:MAG: response regulator transcription factor [Capsulimonadales bacterium]|nr:response regulator transcription factor [Capsulimonadales bacterium]
MSKTTGEKIRVLLADDHAMIREGLSTLLNAQPDMEVVGEVSDGRMAVEKARQSRPDIIVMDVTMPRMSGATATAEIRQHLPDVRVLALTMHEDRSYLHELLKAGATGYVIKRSAANDLIRAIRTIAAGGVYLDPTMAGKVVSGFVGKEPTYGGASVNGLSEREEAVLRQIAHGYSNKEIAAQLSLSVKTVETYKARSTEKLGLNSRVDIVRYARDRGWLEEM